MILKYITKNIIYKIYKSEKNMQFLEKYLFNNPKYTESKRIVHYAKQVYSQNGEDGIINEIFNRIGTTNKFFIEFGVENGLESNTAYLSLNDWKGLWIEADRKYFDSINKNFKEVIVNKQLKIKNSFITPENIEPIFEEFEVPANPDLLSIDIDSTDYWIRKAIKNYNPRLLIMEYNPTFFPPTVWIAKKNQNVWKGDTNYGASLQALHDLNKSKNYILIGCDFSGTNAFFIRKDVYNKNLFESNTTAEYHYEPSRWGRLMNFNYEKTFDLGQEDKDIK